MGVLIMKSRYLPFVSLILLSFIISIGACTGSQNGFYDTCDPKIASLADPGCRIANDAGTDAESDANEAVDADDARVACKNKGGECVTLHEDANGFKWEGPHPVWFGPATDAPTQCPFEGKINLKRYEGLHAPPLDCAPCECEEATGTCAGAPNSISAGTTACTPGGISTPFDGPENWDGSCTSTNAIAAGAQCPLGSGTPCVASIAWSALPGPEKEACAVKVAPVPGFNGLTTSWKNAAVACESSMARDLCGNGSEDCVPASLYPWAQCVWLTGEHKCPENFTYSRRVMYEQEPKDSRSCSACSCGEPVGGSCIANFRVFKDSACSSEILNQPISSEMPDCNLIFPAGSAVGSKSVSGQSYLPGSCAVSGGEPMGEAVEDKGTATTICCQKTLFFAE
jgi:hypothetical protein